MTVNVIRDLFEHGQYQAILDRLAQQDIQAQLVTLSEPDRMELSYYQSRALLALGQAEKGFHVASTVHTTLQATAKKSPLLLASLSAHVRALHFLGQVRDVEQLLTEGDALLQGLTVDDQAPNAVWIPVYELSKGLVWEDRNQDLALDFLSQALTSFEKLASPSHLAETLRAIGYANYHKEKQNAALEYSQRSLALYKKLEHKAGIANVFIIIGHVYGRKGEINKSFNYYQQSLTFAEASGVPSLISKALRYVGWVQTLNAEFDTAIGCLQRALSLTESIGDTRSIGDTSDLLGWAYHQKGELDTAFKHLQRSVNIGTLLKSGTILRRGLVNLINLALSRQDRVQAQTCLTALKNLATRSANANIHFRSRLMEAVVSKESPRLVDKIHALTLLKQLVTEESFRKRWHLTMQGLLHLCDLSIYEAQATGENEAWEEAKTFLGQFHARAQDRGLSEFLGDAILLKAKFAQIDGDLQQAQTYLSEAKTLATELDMSLLVEKVAAEETQLATDFEKWSDLIRRNAPLQERLMEARLEEYLQKAQDALARLA